MLLRIALGLICAVAVVAPAGATDFDKYCNLEGFTAPLRQTVIVIDERNIAPEADGQPAPKNLVWRKFIGNLLFVDRMELEQNFLPREHITVLIARKDGAGTRTVFSGCLPFFSDRERIAIGKGAGYMRSVNTFFGFGPVAEAKKDMDMFRIQVGDGVQEALQPSMMSPRATHEQPNRISSSSLVLSLKQSNFINMAFGIPRIVIYSDLARFFFGSSDRAIARQSGLDNGSAVDLDLKGAEVHVVGASGTPYAKDALEMFFLASHGELLSLGASTALPAFAANPIHVRRYQGRIAYPNGMNFPIRIRIATDQNGTLVNSWVWAQTTSDQFAPLHGVLTCSGDAGCQYSGDGVFAQLWNVNRSINGEPTLGQELSFGGARTFGLQIQGAVAKGSISDSQVHFEGLKSNRLEFRTTLQPAALF